MDSMAYHAEAQRKQRVIDRKHEAMRRLRERAVRIELKRTIFSTSTVVKGLMFHSNTVRCKLVTNFFKSLAFRVNSITHLGAVSINAEKHTYNCT